MVSLLGNESSFTEERLGNFEATSQRDDVALF
jgi:hypothetical protein